MSGLISHLPLGTRMYARYLTRQARSLPRALPRWWRYLGSPGDLPPDLSLFDFQHLQENWYHDFASFGVKTRRIRRGNQISKDGPLFEYIDAAMALCGPAPSGLELFCADGYYGNYAAERGATVVGIDIDPHQIAHANLITRLLGHSATFRTGDVMAVRGTYDFCICAGGLYHMTRPMDLLRRLRETIRIALVIQTVYALDTPPDYFESPAPGRTKKHSCRFSFDYLVDMVEACGWRIVRSTRNELEDNRRWMDRGSAYLLCTRGSRAS